MVPGPDMTEASPLSLKEKAARLAAKRAQPAAGSRLPGVVTRLRKQLANALDPTLYLQCPCCGELATSFLPHGVKARPNAKCPGCGSLERNRLQLLYLQERTNLFTDRLKVLHFAPERALQKRLKAEPKLTYHSADLSSKWADEHFDICAIPYPDDTFDVILCSHVLEHVPDDRKAMSELFRVMKPGGWGLIDAPHKMGNPETFEDPSVTTAAERQRVFGHKDHVRIYGRDYFQRLRAAGFETARHVYTRELPAKTVEKYRLPKDGVISISTKPTR